LSARCKINEKYLKKVLASLEKGRTFAPAFPKEEGHGRQERGKQVL
jgi:hypothetical protein